MEKNEQKPQLSLKQFKLITWGVIASNIVYFVMAYFMVNDNSDKNDNISIFIKNNSNKIFWIVFFIALIFTVLFRMIVESFMNKKPAEDEQQYYSREIVKLVYFEIISIIGLSFIALAGFQWLYSLFFITPIALMLKFFPSEYNRDK